MWFRKWAVWKKCTNWSSSCLHSLLVVVRALFYYKCFFQMSSANFFAFDFVLFCLICFYFTTTFLLSFLYTFFLFLFECTHRAFLSFTRTNKFCKVLTTKVLAHTHTHFKLPQLVCQFDRVALHSLIKYFFSLLKKGTQ